VIAASNHGKQLGLKTHSSGRKYDDEDNDGSRRGSDRTHGGREDREQPTNKLGNRLFRQMGDTMGHYAAYRGHFKVLKYLITKGDKFEYPNTVSQ